MSKEAEEKKSVLRAIIDQVYECPSRDLALIIVKDHLEKSSLPQGFKDLMIRQAQGCETLIRLQTYITNSFLKYEMGGVIKSRPRY